MLSNLITFITSFNIDTIDQFADRVGLTSIAASIGLTITKGVVDQPWELTDYALLISCVGGLLFIVEKLFVIYLRYKESKQLAQKDQKRTRNSRNLP